MLTRFCSFALTAVILAAAPAFASTIAFVESQPAATAGLTIDQNPIITAILSQPGTVNARTYSSWAFLANDGTGSMTVFGAMPNSYIPTVGDSISATGTYSPFHQIPELASLTAISASSSGNAIPAIAIATIPQLNQGTQPFTNVEYLWELQNITVAGEGVGNWGTSNSPAGATISDGVNSMTLFYWPTSYSTANANLANTPIPTGPVNMIGFVSNFGTTAEFTPILVTAVPEPASITLLGLGAIALLRRRR